MGTTPKTAEQVVESTTPAPEQVVVEQVAPARRSTKNAILVPEEQDRFATLVNASRARAEGSDEDYIRIGLRLYTASGCKTVSVFVNEKFYEKTGMASIVTLEGNALHPCCVDKPVVATIIEVPLDGNSYGYVDRETGEIVEYTVKGQRILRGLSGKDTAEVVDMEPERRDAIYREGLFAYLDIMKRQQM